MASAAKRKRNKKGQYLPLGNLPKRDNQGRFLPLGNTPGRSSEASKPSSKSLNPTLKKIIIVGGVITTIFIVYKGIQMLDIQENIQVKMAGLRNAHMNGITGFGFTLNVKLINTTKSSMTMSYPVVAIVAKRAATKSKPAKEIQITQSKQQIGTVNINPNDETLLSFDFDFSFSSLFSIAASINPFTLFSNILTEITTPTGKDGKPNLKPILAGTGLSFWANTQIYAAGLIKANMSEQIF